eukprot:TRINITY_DN6920_c0_g1_i2.p1 TRINITY_DN6920_c0_g1~~TRINITY_DN6920_c0_g1_i2.p1  ORF type:complete len:165 (+),score=22.75 TRINITY_DN6920_c0_g1_i2:136-630(+)
MAVSATYLALEGHENKLVAGAIKASDNIARSLLDHQTAARDHAKAFVKRNEKPLATAAGSVNGLGAGLDMLKASLPLTEDDVASFKDVIESVNSTATLCIQIQEDAKTSQKARMDSVRERNQGLLDYQSALANGTEQAIGHVEQTYSSQLQEHAETLASQDSST